VLQAPGRRDSATASLPTYDRADLSPGIVHIGVGAFHRAHQGIYLDELAERRISNDWGVVGVGLRTASDRDTLLAQGNRYAVLQRTADRDEVRVVGSLLDYLFAPGERAAVLAALTSPTTKVVSLTVTGNGYGVDADGDLDPADDNLTHDLLHPGEPRSLPGYLVESLRLRRDRGIDPFTVISCDNIVRNGDTARRAVVSFARLRDERLADWIEENVAFPSSVVDRITPGATEESQRVVEADFGLRDSAAAVLCEDYRQWIVEDEFCNERPPLEEVGVKLVADATPFELIKKRLLNGSHCAIGYVGYLCGHRRIDDALADPLLRRYLRSLMDDDVSELLPRPIGIDLGDYKRTLLRRFANPRIGDPLQRLCGRGSTKMPAYLLPSLEEALERGTRHRALTLAVAAWVRYLTGTDFEGRPIEIQDRLLAKLQPLARRAAEDPRPLLAVRSAFGDLGEDEIFVAELRAAIRGLDRVGPRAAVESCLSSPLAVAA
jgi:fructuronate reductase/mannitol 2-dehydrogenase